MTFAFWDDGVTTWDEAGVYWDNAIPAAIPSLTIQQFDYSVNLIQALLWQYNDATNLQGLINAKQTWYDTNQQQFWTDWYNDVFNIATANDFGCAVWGYILGLSLSFDQAAPASKIAWGFGQYRANFNNGNFAQLGGIYLTTAEKQLVLQLRAYQLVSSGCVPEINRFMKYLFQDLGEVYLVDGNNMTQTYVFEFTPDPNLLQVLNQLDLMPRPTGVSSTIVVPS